MKKRYYNIWWGVWLAVLIGAGISILVAVWQSRAFAGDFHTKIPKEPPRESAVEWSTHRSLGIILTYKIDGLYIQFSHPVQQCKATNTYTDIHVSDEILYVTTASDPPVRYEANVKATGYKWTGQPFWTPLIQKSYYGDR